MRTARRIAALAGALMLGLSACSADEVREAEQPDPTSSAPGGQDDPTSEPTSDNGGDRAQATTSGPDQDGGEQGQAAAAAAERWITALATGDPSSCDLMTDSTGTVPLAESAAEYDLCLANAEQIAENNFTDELVSVIEEIEISGAEIDGDRAVIDSRHLSELFASAFTDASIRLLSVDGAWYVDMSTTTF